MLAESSVQTLSRAPPAACARFDLTDLWCMKGQGVDVQGGPAPRGLVLSLWAQTAVLSPERAGGGGEGLSVSAIHSAKKEEQELGIRIDRLADLTGVVPWIERRPMNQPKGR